MRSIVSNIYSFMNEQYKNFTLDFVYKVINIVSKEGKIFQYCSMFVYSSQAYQYQKLWDIKWIF